MKEAVSKRGKVIRKRVGQGSRYDHVSTVLVDGASHLELREPGGSAFNQSTFDPYLDADVEIEGVEVNGKLLFVQSIKPA